MFWSMAAGLRNMVVKKFKGSSSGNNKQELVADTDLTTTQGASARRFDSFQDQLKQIRLSKDYLENNPKIKE